MENETRHIRILIAGALILCAVLIGYNLFFVKEPQAVVLLETDASSAQTTTSTDSGYVTPAGKVNINTATAEELSEALDGIGITLAQRIVAYRDANGPFTDINQLQNVSGIGEKRFATIRDSITIS